MAFLEIMPECRLQQFKETEGRRGRAFQTVARWGEKHTHHRVDIRPKWRDGTDEGHGIQSHHFMANIWGNNGNCERIYFLGLQNHCNDCSHEIKRCLLLRRNVITNLDNILKNRDITLTTKVSLVKAMVFPVVMYGCESWTIKKAELWRIDAFELCCWRRLLRVPQSARRSN